MAITTDDLFRLERTAKLRADRLRKEWPDGPADAPEVRAHCRLKLAEARDLDQMGDFILGMQGLDDSELASVMEMLRTGYRRMSRSYDKAKTYVVAVETKAEEPAGEVAA